MNKINENLFNKFLDMVDNKSREEVISELGISQRTYYYWKKKAQVAIQPPPKTGRQVDEIIQHKKEMFNFKVEADKYFDNIKVVVDDKPFGILFFGDPHIDNIGTNLEKFEEDLEVVKNNDSVFAIGLGDYIDNWVGYLTKLYAKHSITQDEVYELVKKYFADINWLSLIIGNHDLFQNSFTFYLKEIVGSDTPIAEFIRLNIQPENQEPITIHMRHSFKGKSQYNPAFPLIKQAIFNYPDDIIVQGHTHQTGYSLWVQPFGYVSHCVVVGSYKQVDSFGKQVSLVQQNHSPSCLVIIQPSLSKSNIDRIKVFFDVNEGIKYLNYLKGVTNDEV